MWGNYEKKLFKIFIGFLVLGTLLFGREFFSLKTVLIMSNQLPEYGLIALALMVTLVVGGINFSIVSMATLAGITGALVMGYVDELGVGTIFFGVSVMLGVGVITGGINGGLISFLDISPILTTFGTMMFYRGIAMNMTKGGAITSFPEELTNIGRQSFFGVPWPLIIFLITLGGVGFWLHQTGVGKQLYRIGKNRDAAIYSGIPVKRLIFVAYVVAGGIAGIVAILMTARYNSIRVGYGETYLLNGFVIASLGGVDIKGGKGTVMGVLIAGLIMSLFLRIMNLAHMDANLVNAIMGVILLVNLGLNRQKR